MAHENFNSGGNSYQLNKYLYNGKELQDDVLGGVSLDWYDYGHRMYDPAIGRFHTQDWYSEDYYSMSNYQYAANNPILFIDVMGDSAWTINNEWNDETISQYHSYVLNAAVDYLKNGSEYTCEDFALSVLIDFASSNGLPVSIENGTGTFSASSDDYTDASTFKNDVLKTTGARDLQRDANTSEVAVNNGLGNMVTTNANPGDVILFRDRGPNANHTQVVTGVSSDGTQTSIAQGNSNNLLRLHLGSGDPQSSRYYGKSIEMASWMNIWNTYTNYTTGNKETHYSNNHNIQVRRFNFKKYNGK